MRRVAIATMLWALGTGLASAQPVDCYDCVLGLYDDAALTRTRGTIVPGVPKDIYLGLKLAAGFEDAAAVEFSIAGFQDDDGLMLIGTWALGPRALIWGNVPAPADTTLDSEGDGGATIAWSECRADDQALVRLTLYTSRVLENKLLVIKRSYPPTSPHWKTPIFTQCDRPVYTVTRLSGACFVLNPGVAGLNPCENPKLVAVESTSWTAMKRLYD
jgi:hypothetical protein